MKFKDTKVIVDVEVIGAEKLKNKAQQLKEIKTLAEELVLKIDALLELKSQFFKKGR